MNDKYDFEMQNGFPVFKSEGCGFRRSITPMLPDDFKMSDSFRERLQRKHPFTELTPGSMPELIEKDMMPNIVEQIGEQMRNEGDRFVYTLYIEKCAAVKVDPQIVEKQAKELKRLQDRLIEYEDKLQRGKMIELPCEIGDTVYWHNGIGNISVCQCRGFSIHPDGIRIDIGMIQPFITHEGLFYSKKEAEAAAKAARGLLNG